MAMASFCGIDPGTGLAESCLSLFMERRNLERVSLFMLLPDFPTLCCTMPRTFMMTVGAPAGRAYSSLYAVRTWMCGVRTIQ